MPPEENQPQSIPKSSSAEATEDVPKDESANEEPADDLFVEKEPLPGEASLSDPQQESESAVETPTEIPQPLVDSAGQPKVETESQVESVPSESSPNFIQNLLIKARAKIQERKQKKLDKIMTMFDAKPKITNQDIQKLLRISSATSIRYLDTLQAENRIKQIGTTGKAVFYTKI